MIKLSFCLYSYYSSEQIKTIMLKYIEWNVLKLYIYIIYTYAYKSDKNQLTIWYVLVNKKVFHSRRQTSIE